MAKRIELSKEEQQLYNELQKLTKRANQRLVRLERLTGEKGTFASRQLYDYLGINELNAITSASRIRISKEYTIQQMLAVKKATEQFLKEKASTVAGVKKIKAEYEEKAEVPLSYEQADVLYRSGKSYTWIYEYIPKSEFWGVWVPTARKENWDKETFAEQISLRIGMEIDEELKADLEALYIYVMG